MIPMMLTRDQAWNRCLRRRARLLATAARLGLADQADDIVHDVFVSVMALPRLHAEGFDSLLDIITWRRCMTLLEAEAARRRLARSPLLRDSREEDPAPAVVEALHAQWVLRRCGAREEADVWMLLLVGWGYTQQEIAMLAGTDIPQVDKAVRRVRRRFRARLRGRDPVGEWGAARV